MRFVRYRRSGSTFPGLLDREGRIRDLSGRVSDIRGATLPGLAAAVAGSDPASLPLVEGSESLDAPIGGVGKLIGIGLNYWDHAMESHMSAPDQPVVFLKATSAICGPNDPILLPPGAEKLDWEVELGVVIGSRACRVGEGEALDHVFGCCIVNDVSERAFQLEGTGQWTKGKSADSFAPIGPWLVSVDEIPDLQSLELRLAVNGRLFQEGSTAKMIFSVAQIISHVSRYMTLHPGDVITTGTPAGVGLGQQPPVFLKEGDEVTLEVSGLGRQVQTVVAAPERDVAASAAL